MVIFTSLCAVVFCFLLASTHRRLTAMEESAMDAMDRRDGRICLLDSERARLQKRVKELDSQCTKRTEEYFSILSANEQMQAELEEVSESAIKLERMLDLMTDERDTLRDFVESQEAAMKVMWSSYREVEGD